MANPLVPQGTLNRLVSSILFNDFPQLNATASFLGKGALQLALEGATSEPLPTLTGVVQSPEPYQMGRVMIHLLKSQNLANVYKAQIESNVLIGDTTVRTDAPTFAPYNLVNCSLSGTDAMSLDGTQPEYVVTVTGIYYVNQSLYGA